MSKETLEKVGKIWKVIVDVTKIVLLALGVTI